MPEKGTIGIKVVADLSDIRKKIGGLGREPFSLKLDSKGFSQPLGRITGKLGEFDKSLEASNARVIAFGASAGAIYAIEKALKSTVSAAINVEKQLADINVILNASSKNLAQFGDQLFRIAATTGQSFQTVATAATELARQGLSVEETLKRTSDALVLTRLSGLSAVNSVESLTAAINSFNKTALTSTEIVNKLANVDAAFAVSSADLAEALRRVGSTAADAGVSFDQLVAAVTSAQQTTARGGSVIGNSFKTIFTRLQRPAVLNQLEQLGIKTKTLGDETRPVIGILSDLAKVYDKLGSSQRSQISELIGGVFQINIVKAALSDLGKEYGFYDRALKTSAASTNEAIKRNEELNKTLSALINKTFANLEKVGSRVGEGAFGPAIKTVLGAVNSALDSSDTEKGAKDFGGKMAEGIFKGLGDFLSGPGLVIGGALLIKLFGRLSTTLADAFKTINTNNKATQVRIKLEEQAFNWLAKHPDILAKIVGGTMSIKDAQKQVVDSIKMSTTALNVQYTAVQKVVSAIMAGGKVSMETGLGAGKIHGGSLKAGGGLVPTRKERDGEKALAAAYGYSAGGVMADNIEGVGRVVYNSREKKVKFPGMSTEAIIPPKSSKAGKTYKKEFNNKHGFDPYSASENMAEGYVPNFAKFTDPLSFKRDGNKYQISGNVKNVLGLYGKHQGVGSKFWKHMQKLHVNKRTGNRRGRKPSKLEQDDLVTMTAMVKGFSHSRNPTSLERISRDKTGSADPVAIRMGKKSKMVSGVGKVGKGGDRYSKQNKLAPGQIRTDSGWVQKGGSLKTKKGYVGKQGTELYPTDLAAGSVAGFDFERGDAKRNLKDSLVGNDAKNFYKATIGKNLRASLMENDYVRGFKEATKERRDRVTLGNYLLATTPDQVLPDSMSNKRFKNGKAMKRVEGIGANAMAGGAIPNFARRVFDKDAYLQKYADKGLLQSRLDETGAKNIEELFDHDVMNAGRRGKLTLINAPPGAGKTSLAVGKTGKGQMTFDSNNVKGGDQSVVVRASQAISSGPKSIMNRSYAPFVDKFISLLPDSEAIRSGRESRNKSGKFMFGRGKKQTSGATTDFDAAAAVLHSSVPFGKHKGLGRGATGGWNMMSGSSFPAAHTVPVATTRGAFSPFTKGHQSVVDQMRKTGMPMSINVSGGADREADIGWSTRRKRDLIKQTNPDAFVFSSKVPPETFTAPSDMTVKVGNKNIKIKKGDAINTATEGSKMFLGSDRAQQSKTGKSGLFDIAEVNRTGQDISATKVRQAIAAGDKSTYSSMLGGPTNKFVDENIGDIQKMQGMIGKRNTKKLSGMNNKLSQLWGEMGIPFDPSGRSPVLSAKRKKEFPEQTAEIQRLKHRKKGLGSHKWTKRIFPNLAGGSIPNFASQSDAAVIQTMTQRLFGPKPSVSGFNNPRWMGLLNKPQNRSLLDRYNSLKVESLERAGATQGRADEITKELVSGKKVNTLFLENRAEPFASRTQPNIMRHGFDPAIIPNVERTFNTSLDTRWEKLIKGVAFDSFSKIPHKQLSKMGGMKSLMGGLTTRGLSGSAATRIALGPVRGRVFEELLSAMSNRVDKNIPETGTEGLDFSNRKFKPKYRRLFSQGPAITGLGGQGMEIRSGSISNPHALRKAGFAAGGSLGEAIGRETAAGVPRSAIRIGASSSLASGLNPAGLGVYNTIDEPGGLSQGINMHRASGLDPRKAGIPNFAGFSGSASGSGGMSGRTMAGMAESKRAVSSVTPDITEEAIDDFLDTTKEATSSMDKWKSKALHASFIFPMVSGQLQSMVGSGTKASKHMESLSNGVGIASSFFAIGGGPWSIAIGGAVGAFTIIDGALTTASSKVIELSKRADESKEQMTRAGNALSSYSDGLQKYQEALKTGDAELTVRLQKNLNKQLAEVPAAFREQVLAARSATDLQNKLGESLEEMAKSNSRIQFAASLEKTVTGERTGFANSAMRGGIASYLGKETFDIDVFEEIPGAAKKFASELRSTLDFQELSKHLKEMDFTFGEGEAGRGALMGSLARAGAGEDVLAGIKDLSSDDIKRLSTEVGELALNQQLATEQVQAHSDITEKYSTSVENAARTVKVLEERFKTFIVNGQKAAEMLGDQITASDKLIEMRSVLSRGDKLGDAQRSLATRKPFMTEENVAISEARIGRRKRLDDRNASMANTGIENDSQKRNAIISLRTDLLKALEAKATRQGQKKDEQGKLVPVMTPQESTKVANFLTASAQALASGNINGATPGALNSLLPGQLGNEMGGKVSSAQLDILKANQTQNQKLDILAEQQKQSRITEEKQLQAQLEQISIQKDIAGAGGMEGFASGQGLDQALDKFSTGMVGMIAGRKRGSLSIAGRGAAMVEGSIQDVTGRPSGNMQLRNMAAAGRAENLNFGMGLMRGGLGSMGLGANGLGRGDANRMAQNQADAFFKTGKPITPEGDKMDSGLSLKLQQHSIKSAVTREAYLKNILTVLSNPQPILDQTKRAKEQEAEIKENRGDEIDVVLKKIDSTFDSFKNFIDQQRSDTGGQLTTWERLLAWVMRATPGPPNEFVPEPPRGRAKGYLPNFAGGRRGEKRSVMDSPQYSPTEKSRAIPNRKMVNGEMTYTNHLEKIKNNYGGSGQSAVLTPAMMRGGFANGYVPNFSELDDLVDINKDAFKNVDITKKMKSGMFVGMNKYQETSGDIMKHAIKNGFLDDLAAAGSPQNVAQLEHGLNGRGGQLKHTQGQTAFDLLWKEKFTSKGAKPGQGLRELYRQLEGWNSNPPKNAEAVLQYGARSLGIGAQQVANAPTRGRTKAGMNEAARATKPMPDSTTIKIKKPGPKSYPTGKKKRPFFRDKWIPESELRPLSDSTGRGGLDRFGPELPVPEVPAKPGLGQRLGGAVKKPFSSMRTGLNKFTWLGGGKNLGELEEELSELLRLKGPKLPSITFSPDEPTGFTSGSDTTKGKPKSKRGPFVTFSPDEPTGFTSGADADTKPVTPRTEGFKTDQTLYDDIKGEYGGTRPGAKPSMIPDPFDAIKSGAGKFAKGGGAALSWLGEAASIRESHRFLNPNVGGGRAPSGFMPGDIAKGRVPSGGSAGHRVSALGSPALQGGTGAGYNQSLKGLKGLGKFARFGLKWLSGAGEVQMVHEAGASSGTFVEAMQEIHGITIGKEIVGGLGRQFDVGSHTAEEENELFNKSLNLKSEKLGHSFANQVMAPTKNMNQVFPLQDKRSHSKWKSPTVIRNKEDRDFFNKYSKKLIETRKNDDNIQAWDAAGDTGAFGIPVPSLERLTGLVGTPMSNGLTRKPNSSKLNKDWLYNDSNRARFERIRWQLNHPDGTPPEDKNHGFYKDHVKHSRDSDDSSVKHKQNMIALDAQMEKDSKKRDWMIGQGISIWKLTDVEMNMSRPVLQKKFHSGSLGYMVKETLANRKPQQGDLGFPHPNKPNYPVDTPQAYQGFGLEGGPKDIKEQGKAELIKKIGGEAYSKNFNEDGSPKAWSPEPIDKKTLARNQKAALKLAKERRRYGGLTKAEWSRLSPIDRRLRSGGSTGFANGYIPNFASLTPDYSQFSWRNNDNSLNPYDRNFMMSTPGLRGLLNPDQSFGRTFANGLVPSVRASQNRERMQSGRNDVYSRYIDTPKYSGMATFNGSERGREESIVRNHPNPRSAGATPNFASGTEDVSKLSKVMTNLNIQIASLSEKIAQVKNSGETTQGQAQVSMSPLNVNINHSGRLTAQVEEIQSQISSAVNEAMKQIAPALWRTIKGPATS